MAKFPAYFFAIVWSIGVIAGICAEIYYAYKQNASNSWPSASGIVDSSEVIVSRGRKGTSYHVRIAYHYQIAGVTYKSARRRFSEFSVSSDWAERFINTRPAGAMIPVYYDPSNPGEAVLEQGLNGMDFLMPAFFAPFVVVGLVVWMAALEPTKQEQQKQRKRGRRPKPRKISPIVVGMVTWGIVSFLSLFVVMIGWGLPPPKTVAIATLLLDAAIGIIGILIGAARNQALDD